MFELQVLFTKCWNGMNLVGIYTIFSNFFFDDVIIANEVFWYGEC